MVALADWYILPILPPIGETFRPFKYQRRGPHAFGCVQDFTPASWTFGSTRMYGFEHAVRGIRVGLLLQHISMGYCILLGCVIVGLQVQPVCMTMSILTSWWKLNQVIGSIFNHQANDKIPCGWKRNYVLIFVLEYIVKQLKLRVVWKTQ